MNVKKISLISLFGIMTLLLKANITVWTGNFESGDWTAWLDISGSSFNSLQVGNVVEFVGTANTGAQIQINKNDWSTPPIVNYDPFTGTSYKISITSSNINLFKAGIHVKGQKFNLTAINIITSGTEPETGVAMGEFHISGTKLLDAKGNEFVMRGVNYSYAWQAGHQGTVIPAAKAMGFNCIRIQLSDGGKGYWTVPSASDLESLIQLCESNKLIAIFNTHDETGSNDVNDLERAAQFWIGMKDVLNAHLNTVIVNISNEWCGQWDSNIWATGYKKVIPELRAAGIKNTLMVDAAGWGQYPQSIFDKGAEVLSTDVDGNMMYSIHMYEYAGYPADNVISNIDNGLKLNCPLVIGEFGYMRDNKPVAYQTILDYCQQKSVGWIGWSWTGNGGTDAVLDMFQGYDANNMLTNGDKIINSTNGAKDTSKECSVFSITTGIDVVQTHDDIDKNSPAYNIRGQRVSDGYRGIIIKKGHKYYQNNN